MNWLRARECMGDFRWVSSYHLCKGWMGANLECLMVFRCKWLIRASDKRSSLLTRSPVRAFNPPSRLICLQNCHSSKCKTGRPKYLYCKYSSNSSNSTHLQHNSNCNTSSKWLTINSHNFTRRIKYRARPSNLFSSDYKWCLSKISCHKMGSKHSKWGLRFKEVCKDSQCSLCLLPNKCFNCKWPTSKQWWGHFSSLHTSNSPSDY